MLENSEYEDRDHSVEKQINEVKGIGKMFFISNWEIRVNVSTLIVLLEELHLRIVISLYYSNIEWFRKERFELI